MGAFQDVVNQAQAQEDLRNPRTAAAAAQTIADPIATAPQVPGVNFLDQQPPAAQYEQSYVITDPNLYWGPEGQLLGPEGQIGNIEQAVALGQGIRAETNKTFDPYSTTPNENAPYWGKPDKQGNPGPYLQQAAWNTYNQLIQAKPELAGKILNPDAIAQMAWEANGGGTNGIPGSQWNVPSIALQMQNALLNQAPVLKATGYDSIDLTTTPQAQEAIANGSQQALSNFNNAQNYNSGSLFGPGGALEENMGAIAMIGALVVTAMTAGAAAPTVAAAESLAAADATAVAAGYAGAADAMASGVTAIDLGLPAATSAVDVTAASAASSLNAAGIATTAESLLPAATAATEAVDATSNAGIASLTGDITPPPTPEASVLNVSADTGLPSLQSAGSSAKAAINATLNDVSRTIIQAAVDAGVPFDVATTLPSAVGQAGMNAAIQLATTGNIDPASVLTAAVAGGIASGMNTAGLPPSLTAAATNAAGQLIKTGTIDPTQLAAAAATPAVASGLQSLVGGSTGVDTGIARTLVQGAVTGNIDPTQAALNIGTPAVTEELVKAGLPGAVAAPLVTAAGETVAGQNLNPTAIANAAFSNLKSGITSLPAATATNASTVPVGMGETTGGLPTVVADSGDTQIEEPKSNDEIVPTGAKDNSITGSWVADPGAKAALSKALSTIAPGETASDPVYDAADNFYSSMVTGTKPDGSPYAYEINYDNETGDIKYQWGQANESSSTTISSDVAPVFDPEANQLVKPGIQQEEVTEPVLPDTTPKTTQDLVDQTITPATEEVKPSIQEVKPATEEVKPDEEAATEPTVIGQVTDKDGNPVNVVRHPDGTITYEPVTDGPGTDQPVTGGPVTDGPVTDGPVTDGPVTDGPVTDKPITEPPIVDPVDPIVDPVDPIVDPVDPIVEPRPPVVVNPPIVEPPRPPVVVDPPIVEPPRPPIVEPPIVEPPIVEPPRPPVVVDPIVDPRPPVVVDPVVDPRPPVVVDPPKPPVPPVVTPPADPPPADPPPVVTPPVVTPPTPKEDPKTVLGLASTALLAGLFGNQTTTQQKTSSTPLTFNWNPNMGQEQYELGVSRGHQYLSPVYAAQGGLMGLASSNQQMNVLGPQPTISQGGMVGEDGIGSLGAYGQTGSTPQYADQPSQSQGALPAYAMAAGGMAQDLVHVAQAHGLPADHATLSTLQALVSQGLDPDQAVNAMMGNHAGGGQISHLGDYSDGGRLLKGPGDGMSDNIPAMIGQKQPARLADGEFVVPADVVSHLGNGSTDAGAKVLYQMMERVRKARTGNPQQGKQINSNKFMPR